MKLMIDISDSTYEAIMARDWKNAGWLFNKELKAIHEGTPIPDNGTNGDVIKALFPRIKIKKFPTFLRVIEGEEYIPMTYDWWNSPYKRGDTE